MVRYRDPDQCGREQQELDRYRREQRFPRKDLAVGKGLACKRRLADTAGEAPARFPD
jgi:hypothetical protein